jgi:hypothetical protein
LYTSVGVDDALSGPVDAGAAGVAAVAVFAAVLTALAFATFAGPVLPADVFVDGVWHPAKAAVVSAAIIIGLRFNFTTSPKGWLLFGRE